MNNPCFIGEDIAHIFLSYKGQVMTTLVDKEDFHLVDSFPNTWFPKPSKYGFYVVGRYTENGKYRFIQLHRMVMNAEKGLEVDHFNHDTLDNRKLNLRVVDKSTNQLNRISSNQQNKLGIRGIHLNSSGSYVAQIQINKTGYYLGSYKTIEEASAIYEYVESKINDLLSKKQNVIEVINNYRSIEQLVHN